MLSSECTGLVRLHANLPLSTLRAEDQLPTYAFHNFPTLTLDHRTQVIYREGLKILAVDQRSTASTTLSISLNILV